MKVLVILAALICVSLAANDTRCETGANFYCANRDNAKLCDKESYCQQNCWSFVGRVKEFWRHFVRKFNRHPDSSHVLMCTSPAPKRTFKQSVCHDCQLVIGDIDKIMKNKAGWDSITAALRFFCSFLPAYSDMCRELVTDLSGIIDSLEPYLSDPEAVCEKMRMCPKHNTTMLSMVSLFENVYMMDSKVGNGTICDDCQQACQDIIAQLQDPSQQENIKETFEELCDYVGPLKKKCLKWIDGFVPQLINWIISRFTDPLGLCTQLGFCR